MVAALELVFFTPEFGWRAQAAMGQLRDRIAMNRAILFEPSLPVDILEQARAHVKIVAPAPPTPKMRLMLDGSDLDDGFWEGFDKTYNTVEREKLARAALQGSIVHSENQTPTTVARYGGVGLAFQANRM